MLKRLSIFLLAISALAGAQTVDPDLYSGMKWRQIGPFRGGRSLAVAGSVQRPKEYYFGATGGGVWKTTDGGANWLPVSDGFFTTATVGAIAIAPSNPDIVVAGTGERDIRGNISHGDGVYRSDDGAKTWRKIGLEDTQTVSRIVIHPTNPDIIYVAALGHIYGKHPSRGVYKTTDGGKSWTKALAGTDRAGAVNIVMDPSNPEVLLASMWEAWRTPYTMNSGGPGSGLFKSTDGGKTWVEISRKKGLPSGVLGKIGMAISPVDSKRYWAIVEALDGGIYRSDDAGESWTKVNEDRGWRQRAWYYTHIYADPKAKDTIYVLNVGFGKSTDGGKTFSSISVPHSDNHDLWIAPDDPSRMANSNDGGGNVSTDGGKTWTEQTFPTAQIYHVSTDNSFPYRILGAQQDNSTVRILSRTSGRGISATDWTSTAGGESGYVSAKPNDPDIVFGGSYGGDLSMMNHRTGERRSVDPWPDNPMGHGAADLAYRFQWTYPIVFSPHDANLLYTCSQFVLKSSNGGEKWTKISPDLTRNDKSTMGPSGGPITKDNTSVEYYGTVFTVAESPVRRGVIWAGSDDGLIHVTQNGGGSWQNVTPPDMPKWGLVSMIEPSAHEPGTAYAAIDNHENDDYSPYAYVTRDYGKTWRKIVRGIPGNTFFRVVREDRRQKGLLYGGTETGAWVSFNGGEEWQRLQLNLPVTPIHDFAWKEDDLIAATHGRAFWVLDDVTPLQQLARGASKEVRLFAPKDAYRVRWGGGFGGRRGGSGGPVGDNPMSGLVLTYYLPNDAKDLKFEFQDSSGEVFQTFAMAPKTKGFQRTSAFLQYPSYRMATGMVLWNGFPSPITAPPGEYTVTMTVDGVKKSAKFRWLRDPRWSATDADLVEQYKFAKRIANRVTEANDAVVRIRGIRTQLDKAVEEAKKKDGSAVAPLAERFKGAITRVEEAIYQTQNKSGQDPLNYPIRLNDKLAGVYGVVLGSNFRPTAQSYEVFDLLSAQLEAQLKELARLEAGDLKAINAALSKLGIAEVKPG